MQGVGWKGSRRRKNTRGRFGVVAVCAALSIAGVGCIVPVRPAQAVQRAEIDPNDSHDVLATWQQVVATPPSIGFTGNVATCDPGTTSTKFRAAELQSLNALRRLEGLEAVTENPAWSTQAQATALMMSAANELSHFPGASWPCYSVGGADGAGSSNLFLGANGPEAMIGYIADPGATNTAVGHRRWLLCPEVTQVGLGDTPTSNATKVFDGPNGLWQTGSGFVAWPNPGLVPVNLAAPRGLLDRFSVQFSADRSVRKAQVAVTSSTSGGVDVRTVARDDDPYCGPALVFEPARPPQVGEQWTINVTGIENADGDPTSPVSTTSIFTVLSPSVPFVKAAFEDFLGRAPSGPELDREVTALDKAMSRRSLVRRLSGSSEWISHFVETFYRDTLGRLPDPAGLAYWIGQIATGRRSIAQVAGLFYGSGEYFRVMAHADLGTWVGDVYDKVLGRGPDPGGMSYWTGVAARSGRAHVATALYQSSESSRARVRSLYDQLLGRRPDGPGLRFWAARVSTEGDLTLAVDLASSDEYFRRAKRRF